MRIMAGITLMFLSGLTACSALGLTSADDDATDPAGGLGPTSAQLAHDLQITAQYQVVREGGEDVLMMAIVASNTGSRDIVAITGPFPWDVIAYSDSTRSGQPTWDTRAFGGPESAREVTIEAGQSVRFDDVLFPHVPVAMLLGARDSGEVYFSASLNLSSLSGNPPELPAGSIHLEKQP